MSVLKVLQVERKFGKSLTEILLGLADEGLSIIEIAERTTFCREVVGQMVDVLGIRHKVKYGSRKMTTAKRSALDKLAHGNTKHLVEFRGETASVHKHCKRFGIRDVPVYRAIGRGATPAEALEMAVGGGE